VFRLATFNLENLDTGPGVEPSLDARIAILRPQLQRLNADILCLQEINAQKPDPKKPRVHEALDALLEGTAYADFHRASTRGPSGDGPADHHNLVVLSRFPFAHQEQIRHELVPAPSHRPIAGTANGTGPVPVEWDRPALSVTVRLDSGETLHVVNLHLRAPLAVFIPDQKIPPFAWKSIGGWAEGFFLAAVKRAGQALEVRLALERIFDEDPAALIAVCGDFNADEFEVPTRILLGREEDTGNGALAGRALIIGEHSVPPAQRYTVLHHGRPQMLDHILISRALSAWYRQTEIHNEDLGDELVAYRAIEKPPESYHAPVVATFERPGG
jgi:endonuclease/exonuclease/phosphatase family metal-dependent hydrolase